VSLPHNMLPSSGRNTADAIWPEVKAPCPHDDATLRGRTDEIQVLGALLDALPEAALLERAIREPLHLAHEASRTAVLARLRSGAYGAAVFPIVDGSGLPTAPLIDQCAQEHSALALVAICCAPPPRAGALLAAARAGARVVVAPSAAELTALLRELARPAAQRVVVTRASLQGVEPGFLRDALGVAAEVVVDGGQVDAFAAALNVSTRTLTRQLHAAGLASPRSLLAAARLLWACAVMESPRSGDVTTTARLAGFADAHRLMYTARKYAVRVGGDVKHPRLPRYVDALATVVEVLGGRVRGVRADSTRDAEPT